MLPRLLPRWGWPLAVLLAASVGCGKKDVTNTNPSDPNQPTFGFPIAENGTSKLSGKATLGGEPLATGRVLAAIDGKFVLSAGVIQNGQYTLENLPDGPAELFVLLDPQGEKPFPTFGPPGAGGPPRGGPPKGPGPGGPPMPGGPPGGPGGPPMPGGPGGPPMPGGPPGGPPAMAGPMPLPEPFLRELEFVVPPNELSKYRTAHAKYAKAGKNNPLKVTINGNTTFDLILN